MSHIGDHILAQRVRRFQRGCHFVERLADLGDFDAAACLDLLLQVTGGDTITVDYPEDFKNEFQFEFLSATLLKIATALGVPIGYFFQESPQERKMIVVRREDRYGVAKGPHISHIGYQYEPLAYPKIDKMMEPFIETNYAQVKVKGLKDVVHIKRAASA